jgi:hypothetical protein
MCVKLTKYVLTKNTKRIEFQMFMTRGFLRDQLSIS